MIHLFQYIYKSSPQLHNQDSNLQQLLPTTQRERQDCVVYFLVFSDTQTMAERQITNRQ